MSNLDKTDVPLKGICIDVTPKNLIDKINFQRREISERNVETLPEIEKFKSMREVFEDHSILKKSVQESYLTELALYNDLKWENKNILDVGFMDDPYNLKQTIINYASEWSKHCNIGFVSSPLDKADIRISFNQTGSWSYIGSYCSSVPFNEPTMNFGWFDYSTPDFEIKRTTIHEFGHVLGFIHEHQSPSASINWNKQAVYAEYGKPPNSWSKGKVDTNVLNRYTSTEITNSIFDKDSIMIYPIPSRHTMDGYSVDWNNDLSGLDKSFSKILYPFP